MFGDDKIITKLNVSDISKYEMLHILGEGTFGEVIEVQERYTFDIYAAKRLKYHEYIYGLGESILQEINAMKTLKHENIVFLKEVCEGSRYVDEGIVNEFYIIMEYCESDLFKVLYGNKYTIHLPQKKSIMEQILRGVGHIHDMGYFHRDLKPDNILITANGKIKITDFGYARPVIECEGGRAANYSTTVGSPYYTAPEILLYDNDYSTKIDIWSVGCIFAELWIREALFKLRNNERELQIIFDMCGDIQQSVWPKGFEMAVELNIENFGRYNQLNEFLDKQIDDEPCKLMIIEMLSLNPDGRPCANTLLKQPMFNTMPCSCPLTL